MLRDVFDGKRVALTGHTGFKGAWMSEWLVRLGAEVSGLALAPPTSPSLFEQLGLRDRMDSREGEIRDPVVVDRFIADVRPDYVFHLAAQPLVRASYAEPVKTWETNVLGTVHVLEALRKVGHPCVGVFITTDKVYRNREWDFGYREADALGGHDPYSSSKAAAELAIASWSQSFRDESIGLRLASVRAGNVIGGGDWAQDRLVPDAIRALQEGKPIRVRNPHATRPWQHVLEPLSGYLMLAAQLSNGSEASYREQVAEGLAYNFGPQVVSNRSAEQLISEVLKWWPGAWEDGSEAQAVHEAGKLHLSSDRAWHRLGWRPRWGFAETIEKTVTWYRRVHEGEAPLDVTGEQIGAYESGMDGGGDW